MDANSKTSFNVASMFVNVTAMVNVLMVYNFRSWIDIGLFFKGWKLFQTSDSKRTQCHDDKWIVDELIDWNVGDDVDEHDEHHDGKW